MDECEIYTNPKGDFADSPTAVQQKPIAILMTPDQLNKGGDNTGRCSNAPKCPQK